MIYKEQKRLILIVKNKNFKTIEFLYYYTYSINISSSYLFPINLELIRDWKCKGLEAADKEADWKKEGGIQAATVESSTNPILASNWMVESVHKNIFASFTEIGLEKGKKWLINKIAQFWLLDNS